MLRRFIPLLAALLLIPGAAAAESPGDAGPAIRKVIESQLAAFQRDDGVAAFSYASPSIQSRFGSVQNFMAMVRNAYTAVYRPQEVEFRSLRVVDGSQVQEVLFVGPDGATVIAAYFMEQQLDGSWRINGVYLIASTDATT